MEEKRKPRRWGLWLAVACVLFVVYPLSQGPSAWLSSRGLVSVTTGKWLDAFYWPVHLVSGRSPRSAKAAYNSYLRWWVLPSRERPIHTRASSN